MSNLDTDYDAYVKAHKTSKMEWFDLDSNQMLRTKEHFNRFRGTGIDIAFQKKWYSVEDSDQSAADDYLDYLSEQW